MKKLILYNIIIAALIIISAKTYSQNLIAVEHSGTSTFYERLDTAWTHAVTGDIMYLPAASYNISSFRFNKDVHMIGAGSNADSSAATGMTVFNNDLFIISGADNGSIEGIYINGSVYFGTSNSDQTVNTFSINRCTMSNLYLSYNGSSSTSSTDLYINENIVRDLVYCGNAQNIVFSKNIFNNRFHFINGNVTIENNVFLYPACTEYMFYYVSASEIKNNVFFAALCNYYEPYQLFNSASTGNTVSHNLFVYPFTINGGQVLDDNIFNAGDTLFVNQTGNSYNIHHDYHLRSTCPGKNAGTDGTDIGLYGTSSPKKDGEIPYNPHIQTLSVPSSTNSSGQMDISIKVKAQEN